MNENENINSLHILGDIYHHRPPSESKLLHHAHGLFHQVDNQDSTASMYT